MSPDTSSNPVRLFEPLTLRSLTARNRLMVSPMCQYSAPPPGDPAEGTPHDWHYVHLVSRAVGGFGIVMTEATAVTPEGRISPHDAGLWNDQQQAALARIAAGIAAHGAIPAIQLAHAGPKASHGRPWESRRPLRPEDGGWPVVGPTDAPWGEGDLTPQPMSTTDCERAIEQFVSATRRARSAGFQLVEIHAAHGYLLHSFYSPLTNTRTDDYGRDFDGRTRLLMDTAAAVREAWPDELPLFVRVSAEDHVPGGWTVRDSVTLARRLKAIGVDLIDCSSGGASPRQSIKPRPGYQVSLAETIRREADVRTGAVGLIGDPALAERIVATGQADLVILGRMALWDPYWPHHAAKALGAPVKLPVQYARCDVF